MQCGACGATSGADQAFCSACGADLRAYAPPPAPAQQPPPMPGERLASSVPAAIPIPPKKGLSGLAIAGIVVGALFLLTLAGAVVAFLFFARPGTGTPSFGISTPAPSSPTAPAVTPSQTAEIPAQPVEPPPAATPSDGIVTDAEARAVVTKFMDLRLAMDVAGSKKLCSNNMLTGPDTKPLVNDKYWRPDSYKIVKTTPDLMYIHVAIMGAWPSGNEPSIFSVWRDPKSGQVLIDGMLDPQFAPDLWK